MTITLDSVLTVAIGRNGQDGQPMTTADWLLFQHNVAAELVSAGGTIVAHTVGGGLGSDGVNEGSEEESAVFVAINVEDLNGARRNVAQWLREFGQSSACFAFDMAHEPVFATPSGFRPASVDDGFGDWLAEGHARRTSLR
jgi:hypothetical protein